MDQEIRSEPDKEPEDLRTTRTPPKATWSRPCGAPTHLHRSLMFWEVARFLVTTLRFVDILISEGSEVRRDQSSASSTPAWIRVASTPSPQGCDSFLRHWQRERFDVGFVHRSVRKMAAVFFKNGLSVAKQSSLLLKSIPQTSRMVSSMYWC